MDSEQKSHQDFSRSPAGSQLPGVPALNVGLKATTDHKSNKSWGFRQEGRPPWQHSLIDSRISILATGANASGLQNIGGALAQLGSQLEPPPHRQPCYLLSDVLPMRLTAITLWHWDDVSI